MRRKQRRFLALTCQVTFPRACQQIDATISSVAVRAESRRRRRRTCASPRHGRGPRLRPQSAGKGGCWPRRRQLALHIPPTHPPTHPPLPGRVRFKSVVSVKSLEHHDDAAASGLRRTGGSSCRAARQRAAEAAAATDQCTLTAGQSDARRPPVGAAGPIPLGALFRRGPATVSSLIDGIVSLSQGPPYP